uniref:Integrase catalytic domain-containing protein n=1 Tax=Tanacetum cinerariifolium TaxID=118510 RepID=A0A6L2PA15_TANCI|nr:hypothetical protein [Tanacetum cinerariifolium]
MTDYSLWEVILNGDSPTPTGVVDGVVQAVAPTTTEQKLANKNELKARGTLLMALLDKHQLKFNIHKDAKSLMEAIEKRRPKLDDLFKNLKIYEAEVKSSSSTSHNTHNIAFVSSQNTTSTNASSFFVSQSNSPQLDNDELKQIDANDLEEMDLKWQMAMLTMRAKSFLQRTRRNLEANGTTFIGFKMSKVECYNYHRRGHFAKEYMSHRDTRNKDTQRRNVLVESSTSNTLVKSQFDVLSYKTSLESVEARLVVYQQNENMFKEDFKLLKLDVMLRDNAIVELRKKFKKVEQERDELKLTLENFQTSSKNLSKLLERQITNKTRLGYDHQVFYSQVFTSDELTGFESDVSVPTSLVHDRYKSGEGYHAVPCHIQELLCPLKPDLVFPDASTVSEIVLNVLNVKPSTTKPTKDMSQSNRPSAPIIKDWVSDSKDESEGEPMPTQKAPSFVQTFEYVKTPRTSVKPIQVSHGMGYQKTLSLLFDVYGNPQQAFKDKGIIDSGCSRHMTGNISYLSDFKEINRGYVAFYGNPKGGKITRKGKIRTGKLDFDDVYFVKELKFNLFSVSQMCDKKNSVLFTYTKCVVLSSDFKLPDKNHMLLRVLRENNMYNVNLKNIVPSGDLTYLFAKATLDEISWVFFLATKDENSTLKTFITGIENQINHKVKIIRSDNGTEFKNHDLNQFCGMKGIKREFSVARTPQQNEVAERKNRTLIEAARTMLSDSLLPIPFWAEAVSTACYVQNKADEGFLVGYSINNKSFRVFNSRTRIVQETLHINFLENQPNVAGSGPTWMFDIDTLTQSMNYQPVVIGNQPNHNAGIQENLDSGKVRKETESDQQYVLLRLWSTSSKDPKNIDADVVFDVKENEVNAASIPVTAVGPNSTNNTNSFNVIGPSDNAVSPNFEFGGKYSFVDPSQYLDDPDMPALEDIIYSDDEEDVGAKADFSNLETSITVSPILTTRVHKDHLVTQIIGDLSSAPQTRSMARMNPGEYTKHSKILVRLKLCKRSFFNSRCKRSRNKTRLVAQGHTQEEGIDYDDVFAPVARIEAIRLVLAYASFMGFMVYVDDIIFGSTNKKLCKAFEKLMKDKFQMSSMGELTLFLGLQVKQKDNGIFISQDKYVAKILRKFGLTYGKLASTPIDNEKPLLKDPDGEDVDVHIYKLMIGSLMYLTLSRPDIMFTICACAHFQVTLKVSHLHAVKRILGISRTVVATSSTKAEYVATASCCAQVLWIQNKLLDYGKKVIITEDTIRQNLRLDDADGIDCLPNEEIFAELARMGYEKPSTKLTFYKAFFSTQWKFLIHTIVQCMSAKRNAWNEFSSSMDLVVCHKRIGKGFSGVETPLFDAMLVQQQVQDDVAEVEEDEDHEVSATPTPPSPTPTTTPPQPQQEPIPSPPYAQSAQPLSPTQQQPTQPAANSESSMNLLNTLLETSQAESQNVGEKDKNQAFKVKEDTDEAEPIEVEEVLKVVTTAKLMTEVVTTVAPINIVAQVPKASALRRRRGVVIQDPEETAATLVIMHSKRDQKGRYGLAKVKSWKMFESCRIHIITLTATQMFLLVEKKYPLTHFTLEQMLNNVRLKVEEDSEMSLELLSIRPEGFWPSILLLTVIIVSVAIVVSVILVIVDTIIGIVVVVLGAPFIFKLALVITGFSLGLMFLLRLSVFDMVAACASCAAIYHIWSLNIVGEEIKLDVGLVGSVKLKSKRFRLRMMSLKYLRGRSLCFVHEMRNNVTPPDTYSVQAMSGGVTDSYQEPRLQRTRNTIPLAERLNPLPVVTIIIECRNLERNRLITLIRPEVKAKDEIIASTWNLVNRSLTSSKLPPTRVQEKDIAEIVFRTRYGHFEFQDMPFGLISAPEIQYHPGKASVAADALSRNERAKPLRVRALVMTSNSNLSPKIHKAQVESLKKENVKDKNLYGMDKEFENCLDGTLYIRRKSWLSRLSRVHSTFHVSKLKKCMAKEPLAIPLDEIQVDDKLNFIEKPVEIMDREVKRLKQSRISIFKVRWNSKRGPEFTWEHEDQMQKN